MSVNLEDAHIRCLSRCRHRGCRRQWHPDVIIHAKLKVRGHHANNGRRASLQVNRSVDDGRIAAEVLLPKRVTKNANCASEGVTGLMLLSKSKRTAQQWLNSEHCEEVGRNCSDANKLR